MRFCQGVRNTLAYVMHHQECQSFDVEFDQWCDRVVEIMQEAERKIARME